MLDESEPSRRSRRETKPARNGVREGTFFDAEPCGLDIGSIPQKGVEHSAEPVGHGDDRAFVAAPRTELQKIRM
jgi:hypothetical protein